VVVLPLFEYLSIPIKTQYFNSLAVLTIYIFMTLSTMEVILLCFIQACNW